MIGYWITSSLAHLAGKDNTQIEPQAEAIQSRSFNNEDELGYCRLIPVFLFRLICMSLKCK